MPKRQTDLPSYLPLPGSKYTGVHRHITPQSGSDLSWLRLMLPLGVGLLILLAGLSVWSQLRRPVTVVVNGAPVELRTHRATVAGVLRQAGVQPDNAVFVDPPLDARIASGAVILVTDVRPVQVRLGGELFTVETAETDPTAIAVAAGVRLTPGDSVHVVRSTGAPPRAMQLNPALADLPAIPQTIEVIRARTIIVNDGEARVSFTASTRTLGEALVQAGYTLYQADILTPAFDTPLNTAGNTVDVTLIRATPVTLRADGRTISVRTHADTVSELLAENGLALTGQDYITPALDAPITANERIQLTRVVEERVVEDTPIPFETSYVPRPDLELDTLVEIQPGQTGLLRREVLRRAENGQIVNEVEGAQWVVRVPESRVLGYGTKIVIREVMTEVGPVEYWRQMQMLATSYSPSTAGSKKPGDPGYGKSATGDEMQRGIVATDPRVIPLYTYLWVPDYGFARALDVGGAVKGMRIDLGYDDENLVLWNQWVDVYLTLPIPAADQIVYVLPDAQVTEAP